MPGEEILVGVHGDPVGCGERVDRTVDDDHVPQTRRLGATVAMALFLAVFPANVNMVRLWWDKPWPMRLAALARLPFQFPMIKQAAAIRRNAPRP